MFQQDAAALRRVASRIAGSGAADDVLQAALARVLAHCRRGGDCDQPRSYLFAVVRSAAIDYLRTVRRDVPLGDDDDHADVATEAAPPRTLPSETEALARCIAGQIVRLPAPYRKALEALTETESTQADLATALSMSASGTRSRVQRARKLVVDRIAKTCDVEIDGHGCVVRCDPKPPTRK